MLGSVRCNMDIVLGLGGEGPQQQSSSEVLSLLGLHDLEETSWIFYLQPFIVVFSKSLLGLAER